MRLGGHHSRKDSADGNAVASRATASIETDSDDTAFAGEDVIEVDRSGPCLHSAHRARLASHPGPPARRRTTAITIGLVVIALTMGLYARNSTPLSPYDEQQHLDYAVKAGDFRLPADDEKLGQAAMRETACRGIDSADWTLGSPGVPACETEVFDPSPFPDAGYNTAGGAPPGYYLPSGIVARGIEALTPVSSPLLAVRLASVLWLIAGLAVFYLLGREFEARPAAIGIVALLLAVTPVIVTASTHATPDSMLILSGGLVLLTIIRWTRGRIGLWAPIAVCIAAVTIDRSTVLAFVLAGVFVAAPFFGGTRPVRPRLPRSGEPVDPTSATVVLALIFLGSLALERVLPIARDLLTGSTGQINVDLDRFELQQRPEFSREVLLGSFTNMVSPITQDYRPDITRDRTYDSITAIVNWIVIGGAFGTAAWAAARSRQRRLGAAATTTMLVSGPMVAGAMWLQGGVFFELPARYGLAMMPALGVTVALSLRGRVLTVAVGALAVLQFALFGYRALTLG